MFALPYLCRLYGAATFAGSSLVRAEVDPQGGAALLFPLYSAKILSSPASGNGHYQIIKEA